MHLTGGEAVVRSLEAHQVDTVFGIPGTHNLAIYEALRQTDSIRHILVRHEQGAAFMADGYARASGQVGVCLSTTGPAALNTLASLGTAYSDSSPVLCIASQIPAEGIGLDKGFLHECRDQLASFAPVTKWRARAPTPWTRSPLSCARRSRRCSPVGLGRPPSKSPAIRWTTAPT